MFSSTVCLIHMTTSIKRISIAAAALAAGALPAVAMAHDGRGDDRKVSVRNATVESFTDGVLTLKKANGKTVAAKVVDATKIRCRTAAPAPTTTTTTTTAAPTATTRSRGDDDNNASETGREHGRSDDDHGKAPETGDDNGKHSGDDKAKGEDDHPTATVSKCTADALKAGAKVRKAEFRRGGSKGRVWKRVEVQTS